MKAKPFEKWKTEEVQNTFGISQNDHLHHLKKWLDFEAIITESEQNRIEPLQERLKYYVDYWLEEDTKAFFIFPIIDIIDFYVRKKYRPFTEATFEAQVLTSDNEKMNIRGRAEFLVATGEQDPQVPFFFLNEYKPQLKAQSDPKGQLLIAMFVAQQKNNPINIPIYGLYTIGRLWFFVVMQQREYAITRAFDATETDEIIRIVTMLKFVKQEIEKNYQLILKK